MSVSTEEQVIAIIAEQAMLSANEVKLSDNPEEMGLDSLALVEIVFSIEETFDVSVPFNANDPASSEFDISSVGKIVEAVKALVAAKG